MLNKSILMGRLTRDPELRHSAQGTAVCSFSIAVQRKFGGNGQERPTDFINCVAWRTTAEFVAKYFTKGKMIVVVGSIQTRTWEGADGKKNYATEVLADEVMFGESKGEGEKRTDYNSAPSPAYQNQTYKQQSMDYNQSDELIPIDGIDDDLPF